jgi:hypothetical protein
VDISALLRLLAQLARIDRTVAEIITILPQADNP